MGSPVSDHQEEVDLKPAMNSDGLSNRHCPLNALGPGSGNFRATCDVTNKINIDKYFELMKEEFTTTCTISSSPKLPRSNRTTIGRSISSSKIESYLSNKNSEAAPLSPRRKKNAKKRISCDENSLAMYAAHNSMPKHSESYFNYDLSGQMVKGECHNSENHNISRQKSWDLSKSKRKNWSRDKSNVNDCDDVDKHLELSSSFSVSDFRDLIKDSNNNDNVKSSKSCEAISSLGERHKEYAMMQGKIGSVSEENRRHRRKLYRKERKTSDEKSTSPSDDYEGRINHLLEKKLVIDVG